MEKSSMSNNSPPSRYQAPAVRKAFQLLQRVAESHENPGLTKLARDLGFSKSTTHGLIQALLGVGALDHAPGRKEFFLGPAIANLALGSWSDIRLREMAQGFLNDLRDRIGETVFLGGLSHTRGIILAVAEARKTLKISAPPGASIPVLAGAVGKIYLSRFRDANALKIIREHGLKQYTPRSIVDEETYIRELARVRKQKYALDREEYLTGVAAVAVNLENRGGLPLAIWVVGFAGAMDNGAAASISARMKETARRLLASLEAN